MDLKQANLERWQKMHVARGSAFKAVADRILRNKIRYMAVAYKTGVPWEFIAVTHYRESNLDFNTYLGNGEPLNRKTRLVPKGRGPFNTWEDGAIDALTYAPPFASLNKDWSIGGTLAKLEEYNGLGYYRKGLPSPYVWAGTDQYIKGKYVADGVFDPNHIDTQLGCAGLLKFLGWKKTTSVPAAGTVTGVGAGAGVAALAHYWDKVGPFLHAHWPAILGGAIVLGIAADIIYNIIKRNKDNGIS